MVTADVSVAVRLLLLPLVVGAASAACTAITTTTTVLTTTATASIPTPTSSTTADDLTTTTTMTMIMTKMMLIKMMVLIIKRKKKSCRSFMSCYKKVLFACTHLISSSIMCNLATTVLREVIFAVQCIWSFALKTSKITKWASCADKFVKNMFLIIKQKIWKTLLASRCVNCRYNACSTNRLDFDAQTCFDLNVYNLIYFKLGILKVSAIEHTFVVILKDLARQIKVTATRESQNFGDSGKIWFGFGNSPSNCVLLYANLFGLLRFSCLFIFVCIYVLLLHLCLSVHPPPPPPPPPPISLSPSP